MNRRLFFALTTTTLSTTVLPFGNIIASGKAWSRHLNSTYEEDLNWATDLLISTSEDGERHYDSIKRYLRPVGLISSEKLSGGFKLRFRNCYGTIIEIFKKDGKRSMSIK